MKASRQLKVYFQIIQSHQEPTFPCERHERQRSKTTYFRYMNEKFIGDSQTACTSAYNA